MFFGVRSLFGIDSLGKCVSICKDDWNLFSLYINCFVEYIYFLWKKYNEISRVAVNVSGEIYRFFIAVMFH